MNVKQANKVEAVMKRALEIAAKELGGEFIFEGGKYTDNSYIPKVKFVEGSTEDFEKSQFEEYAAFYRLKKSDFGRVVVVDGEALTIIGVRPTRRSYPILVRNPKGKEQLIRLSVIKENM